MSSITPFNFEGRSIRTLVGPDGEPWFVAKDVAEVLGYANSRKAVADHCKAPSAVGGNDSLPPIDPQTTVIPERDVYRLIMRSKLPAAEQFEEWVVGEVLPSIRKTGSYKPEKLDRKALALMVIQAEEEVERLELECKRSTEKVTRMENYFQQGMTLAAFAKTLNGVNSQLISRFCCDSLDWLYDASRSGNNKRWRVKSKARDRYLNETDRAIGQHGDNEFIKFEPRLLKEGAKYLYGLYLDGQLPMKKTWNGEFVHMKFSQEVAA